MFGIRRSMVLDLAQDRAADSEGAVLARSAFVPV